MFPMPFAYWKALLTSLTTLVLITIAPSLLLSMAQPAAQPLAMRFTTNVAAAPLISHNWAGYVATNGTFTSVTGTWMVPQISSRDHNEADATWVGIGGLNRNDLIQSGTQNIVSHRGQVTTVAFIELLPNAGQPIPVSIKGGDSVTVSLTFRKTTYWQIAFRDNTTGRTYNTTVSYPSSYASAEWIEEAPSRGNSILPLDKFRMVQFNGGSTTENGDRINIAQSNAQPIILVNKSGRPLATPSLLASNGTSFIVKQR
jgi:hypothetical protein